MRQLLQEGYFEPNLAHVAYRIGEVIAMYAASLVLIWGGRWWTGMLMMGIAQGRCGWLQHEGGHYSLTGNIKIDRHLQMIIYGLGCGMSGCYWRNQHNKHHAAPQSAVSATFVHPLEYALFCLAMQLQHQCSMPASYAMPWRRSVRHGSRAPGRTVAATDSAATAVACRAKPEGRGLPVRATEPTDARCSRGIAV
jgi:hypothetical protein